MIRARFKTDPEDWRPVHWPPPGPCWKSGEGDGYSIAIAYARSEEELMVYWPDARDVDAEEVEEIVFSDRFARPDWWPEGETRIEGGSCYVPPADGWVCFHCGERFKDPDLARVHFGDTPEDAPVCTMVDPDLAQMVREMKDIREELRRIVTHLENQRVRVEGGAESAEG